MLRQEHFEVATKLFGTDDFDRIVVVHALDPSLRPQITERMRCIRVYWVTARELVRDLEKWCRSHQRATGLRNSLVGDLLPLLWGFCELSLGERPAGKIGVEVRPPARSIHLKKTAAIVWWDGEHPREKPQPPAFSAR